MHSRGGAAARMVTDAWICKVSVPAREKRGALQPTYPCRGLSMPCGFQLYSSTPIDFMFQKKKKKPPNNLGTQMGTELALRSSHLLSPQAPGRRDTTAVPEWTVVRWGQRGLRTPSTRLV